MTSFTLQALKTTAWVSLLLILMSFFVYAEDSVPPTPGILKVCADPYMLPFSNNEEQGYENKIAELFAKKLDVKLEYEWFPQRLGFIRNTLKKEVGSGGGKYACDLVISVPEKFELSATTDPYFTTTYMLVYVKGRGMDEVTDSDMLTKFVEEKKPDLKFGLADTGPAQNWVFFHELMGNMVPYQGQPGDPKVNPGQRMIDELIAGNIDATIVWGPTAGYFAKQYKNRAELVLLPLKEDPGNPNLRFQFSMAMGVRYPDKAWKAKVNELIKENKKEIEQILTDYGVPLIK